MRAVYLASFSAGSAGIGGGAAAGASCVKVASARPLSLSRTIAEAFVDSPPSAGGAEAVAANAAKGAKNEDADGAYCHGANCHGTNSDANI